MGERIHRTHSRQFDGGAIYFNDHGSVRVDPTGYMHTVFVKPEFRGQGHMVSVASMAGRDADRNGKTLRTNAEQDFLAQALEASGRWERAESDHLGKKDFSHLPGYVRRPSYADDSGVQ